MLMALGVFEGGSTAGQGQRQPSSSSYPPSSSSLSQPHADGGGELYNGASRKLEELFVYWLSQKETTEMVEHCVTAVRQGQALPHESALEVSPSYIPR